MQARATSFPACVAYGLLSLTRVASFWLESLGHRALGRRFDSDLTRLGAESSPVIERKAGFVLPLVHHLVQERVQRLVPPMATEMPPGDRDLGAVAVLGRRVVPEPAPHPARDANRHRLERVAEILGVVPSVPLRQSLRRRLVLRTHALAAHRRVGHARRRDAELDDSAARDPPLGARSALDEAHDRRVHLERRLEIPLVHTKLRAAETHHHVAIARELTARDAAESQLAKARQQL